MYTRTMSDGDDSSRRVRMPTTLDAPSVGSRCTNPDTGATVAQIDSESSPSILMAVAVGSAVATTVAAGAAFRVSASTLNGHASSNRRPGTRKRMRA